MFNSLEKETVALLLAFTTGCAVVPVKQIEQPRQPVRGANCPQLQKDYIAVVERLRVAAEQARFMPNQTAAARLTTASQMSRRLYYKTTHDERYGNCDFAELNARHRALNAELLERSKDLSKNRPSL